MTTYQFCNIWIENWSLVEAILVTAENAPFTDSREDIKNVQSGSEIDGGESLFWHLSLLCFTACETVTTETQL